MKNEPLGVRIEDGLTLLSDGRLDPHNDKSPHWYRCVFRGTWRDWVQLAEAIIDADNIARAKNLEENILDPAPEK